MEFAYDILLAFSFSHQRKLFKYPWSVDYGYEYEAFTSCKEKSLKCTVFTPPHQNLTPVSSGKLHMVPLTSVLSSSMHPLSKRGQVIIWRKKIRSCCCLNTAFEFFIWSVLTIGQFLVELYVILYVATWGTVCRETHRRSLSNLLNVLPKALLFLLTYIEMCMFSVLTYAYVWTLFNTGPPLLCCKLQTVIKLTLCVVLLVDWLCESDVIQRK